MKQWGATLLELMVVLAIAGILLAIGVPALAALAQSSRLSSSTNELVASLHLARSEAIKRNTRAVMCPSQTGNACAENGAWHQGWVVFHDPNNNAALDAGEVVLLKQPGLPAGFRLTGNGPVSRYISYTPTGAAKLVGGAWQAGTLTACAQSPNPGDARLVIISSTGRPRIVRATIASCP